MSQYYTTMTFDVQSDLVLSALWFSTRSIFFSYWRMSLLLKHLVRDHSNNNMNDVQDDPCII